MAEASPTPDDILQTGDQLAAEGFASTSFSQGSTSQSAKSLEELANWYRFRKGEAAKRSPGGGAMFRQIVPPGGG